MANDYPICFLISCRRLLTQYGLVSARPHLYYHFLILYFSNGGHYVREAGGSCVGESKAIVKRK